MEKEGISENFKEVNDKRYSADNITKPRENEVFVFGSNLKGIHGAGAAAFAHKSLGYPMGMYFGLSGTAFGIPTKGVYIDSLPLPVIQYFVKCFVYEALINEDKKFLVTEVGCGLAGFQPEEITVLFELEGAFDVPNIYLPKKFHECRQLQSYRGITRL
jgi:hypothetical protein